jgi:hypothetical protein
MLRNQHHSNRRNLLLAAILALPFLASGCTLWNEDTWDLNQYRDERAVDIDQRLERNTPIVKNPF